MYVFMFDEIPSRSATNLLFWVEKYQPLDRKRFNKRKMREQKSKIQTRARQSRSFGSSPCEPGSPSCEGLHLSGAHWGWGRKKTGMTVRRRKETKPCTDKTLKNEACVGDDELGNQSKVGPVSDVLENVCFVGGDCLAATMNHPISFLHVFTHKSWAAENISTFLHLSSTLQHSYLLQVFCYINKQNPVTLWVRVHS